MKRVRGWATALGLLWLTNGHAQSMPPEPVPQVLHAHDGVRLGELLLHQAPKPYDPLSMQWLRPGERTAQEAQRQHLLATLRTQAELGQRPADEAAQLQQRIKALPITGRLPLPLQDARLMQAHPDLEPLLAGGDTIVLFARSQAVAVWHGDMRPCMLRFEPGWPASAYLSACSSGQPITADVAWIAQPDGTVHRVGVASWNASAQPLPAPGAHLWAPAHGSTWTDEQSTLLAKLLATQPPAMLPVDAATAPLPTDWGDGITPPSAHAESLRTLPVSASDWGMTGLLQTPTARLPAAGHAALSFSRTAPYTQYNAVLSPFDALEIGLRYTSISNQLYGRPIAGDQSYKDKSSEIKFRLNTETRYSPAIALGLRDPGGTGLFGGEYVVASKRMSDLDFSLGLGWGYLGTRGNMRNPLAVLGPRWASRTQADSAQGGTANLRSLFTGRTALFGGVQWQTPWPAWQVQIELDGNDYRHEPFAQTFAAPLPYNLGLVWQSGPLALKFGFERGNRLSIGLVLQTDLPSLHLAKYNVHAAPTVDPARLAAVPTPAATPASSPPAAMPVSVPGATTSTLADVNEQTGWQARSIVRSPDGTTWTVSVDGVEGVLLNQRLDRANAVLHRDAPASVTRFVWVLQVQGVNMATQVVDRHAWVTAQTQWLPTPTAPPSTLTCAAVESPEAPAATLKPAPQHAYNAGTYLAYQQQLGGPDGYLYALSAGVSGEWRAAKGTWLQGRAELRLADNYNHFHYTADSQLTRVRTHVREYLTDSRLNLSNLQATHLERWGDAFYGLAYAGWLEPMFAGTGAELMWRRPDSHVAVSIDANHVRQRAFDQHFGLRDYQVNTGHLNLYWDTAWHGVTAQLSAGRYLAGDMGATLDLTRTFSNGTRMGFWVTKTNVAATTFGEGSFDKGVYISIPFDNLLAAWSGQTLKVVWQPLIRDGGAHLQRANTLWDLTSAPSPWLGGDHP